MTLDELLSWDFDFLTGETVWHVVSVNYLIGLKKKLYIKCWAKRLTQSKHSVKTACKTRPENNT